MRIRSSFQARFDDEGQRLAVAGRTGISLWDVEREERIADVTIPGASSVDFAPGGQALAVKDTAGQVLVFSVPELQPLFQYRGPGEGAQIRYAPDGRLVDGSWGGTLVVRDGTTGTVGWHELGDGVFRLATTRDRTWWIHDRFGGAEPRIVARRWPFDEHEPETLPWSEGCLALAIGEDTAAVYNGGLAVFQRDGAWSERARIDRMPASMGECTLTWDGERLVYSLGRRIRVFDRDLQELASHRVEQDVCCVDISGSRIALGDWSDGSVRAWPLEMQAA